MTASETAKPARAKTPPPPTTAADTTAEAKRVRSRSPAASTLPLSSIRSRRPFSLPLGPHNVSGLTCAGRAKRDPRQVQAVVGRRVRNAWRKLRAQGAALGHGLDGELATCRTRRGWCEAARCDIDRAAARRCGNEVRLPHGPAQAPHSARQSRRAEDITNQIWPARDWASRLSTKGFDKYPDRIGRENREDRSSTALSYVVITLQSTWPQLSPARPVEPPNPRHLKYSTSDRGCGELSASAQRIRLQLRSRAKRGFVSCRPLLGGAQQPSGLNGREGLAPPVGRA